MNALTVTLLSMLLLGGGLIAVQEAALENAPFGSFHPSWSPVGERIAFDTDRDGKVELYMMNADGTELRRLTHTEADEMHPAWSPDGTRLVFESNRDGNVELYVMDVDGTELRRLTHSPGREAFPAWSPDGAHIAFSSDRDGNYELYVIRADGSETVRLTHNEAEDAFPAWSPDGTQLAFSSNRGGSDALYLMQADGSQVSPLTETGVAWRVAWSPDGAKLAFTYVPDGGQVAGGGRRMGDFDIFVLDLASGHLTNVTRSPAVERYPTWSPDGTRIAFFTNRDGTLEIYSTRIDGTDATRLTWQDP